MSLVGLPGVLTINVSDASNVQREWLPYDTWNYISYEIQHTE